MRSLSFPAAIMLKTAPDRSSSSSRVAVKCASLVRAMYKEPFCESVIGSIGGTGPLAAAARSDFFRRLPCPHHRRPRPHLCRRSAVWFPLRSPSEYRESPHRRPPVAPTGLSLLSKPCQLLLRPVDVPSEPTEALLRQRPRESAPSHRASADTCRSTNSGLSYPAT